MRRARWMLLMGGTVCVMRVAAAAPLDDARRAMERGVYDEAARIATGAVATAGPDDAGAIWLLLGMAQFRAGRYHEALEAFAGAARAPNPPPVAVLAFNRGAALFKLRRFSEAEAAFLAAASDADVADVATLALLNAAEAALARDDVDGARAHLARARALDSGGRTEGVAADLAARVAASAAQQAAARAAALFSEGTARFRERQFAAARDRFRQAAALMPSQGAYLLMAGVAGARLGDVDGARLDLRAALQTGLDPATRALALQTLDAVSPGLRGSGRGVSVHASLAGGFDSNVVQSGVGMTETLAAQGGSAFLEATADLSVRLAYTERLFAEWSYTLTQLAYLDTTFDDFSLQQQMLSGAHDVALGGPFRLTLTTAADVLLSGLVHFAPFQAEGRVRPGLAWDESPHAFAALELERDWKRSLMDAYDYLGGVRTDLMLSQSIWGRHGRATLRLRYRDEAIGEEIVPALAPFPGLRMALGCPAGVHCGTYHIPYSYGSEAIAAVGRWGRRFRLETGAEFERRTYRRQSYVEFGTWTTLPGPVDPRFRLDHRLLVTLAATASLGEHTEATLRYEVTVNRSNIDNSQPGHAIDYDNKNYTKHVLSLELATDW